MQYQHRPCQHRLRAAKGGVLVKALLMVGLVAALAAGWGFWQGRNAVSPTGDGDTAASMQNGRRDGAGTGMRPGGFDPNRATPVVVATVGKGDIRLVQNGLGTVTARSTVTVRSRVEGQLQRVHFKEGQFVKAGELLAEVDPKPFQAALMQARGQLLRDQAQLKNAQLDLERYRSLLAQDSIAKQQVDTQEALVHQYQGTVMVDQAQVESAQLQLGYTRITAPIAGRIGLRVVDAGNNISTGDTAGLAVITEVQPISVLFPIAESSLPAVLQRLQALPAGEFLPVEAWDRDNKTLLASGRLITTDNQIDATTGTVRLKAEFANRDFALFPNQFVNVRLRVDTLREQTVMPVTAIQRGTIGTFVYVVRPNKTVAVRPVVLGSVDGYQVAVQSGVHPGDSVVLDGTDRLREGAKVEPITREAAAAALAANAATAAAKSGRRRHGSPNGMTGENKEGEKVGGRGSAAPGDTPASQAVPGAERRRRMPDGV